MPRRPRAPPRRTLKGCKAIGLKTEQESVIALFQCREHQCTNIVAVLRDPNQWVEPIFFVFISRPSQNSANSEHWSDGTRLWCHNASSLVFIGHIMWIVITVARKGRQCYIWAGMRCFKGAHIYPLPELFSLTLPIFFVVCIVNPPFRSWSKVLRYDKIGQSRSVR
jgi:hypothetical protein